VSLVLGIESSCDETAAAVVADGHDVRSNVVWSQIEEHRRYGGVVPELASRSHVERIVPVTERALAEAGIDPADLDAVAVTARPGLVGCLLVGLVAAKTIAWRFGLPLVGVDHVSAHVHAAFMACGENAPPLPMLCLVASGGHTALYDVAAPGAIAPLGRTLDDAAGEAFDKAAAILGLPYPGGPSIEAAARAGGDPRAIDLPRPMLGPKSLDFSFSGLKTALLYHLRGNALRRPMPDLDERARADLAASFQEAVVQTLVRKLRRAVRHASEQGRERPRSLAIGGGVARNTRLREALAEDRELRDLELVLPPLSLCSDNAAMVAGLGDLLWRSGTTDDLSLPARPTSRRRGTTA
jgi:N6-L-threonylcarbamoyladenine synthase